MRKICQFLLAIAGYTLVCLLRLSSYIPTSPNFTHIPPGLQRSVFGYPIRRSRLSYSTASITRDEDRKSDAESSLSSRSSVQSLGSSHAPGHDLPLHLEAPGRISSSTRCPNCSHALLARSASSSTVPLRISGKRADFSRIPSRLWNPSGHSD